MLNFIGTGYCEPTSLSVTSRGIAQLRGHHRWTLHPWLLSEDRAGRRDDPSHRPSSLWPDTSALEHWGKMTQRQLAGGLVFSPAFLTRGCWTVWPEASELPEKCLCEDTCNIFWLTNHITCLSPCPGVGRAVLCFNSL